MEDKDMMRLATEVLAADPEKLAAAIETIIKTSEQLDKIFPVPKASVSDACSSAPETSPRGGAFLERLAKRFDGMLKATNQKRSNLQIGGMKLARFKADGRVELVAVDPPRPEVGKNSRDLWRIEGERLVDHSRFVASRNGVELFTVTGGTFSKTEKLAVSCLHKWIEEKKRRNRMRRRAKKAADAAEGSES